MAHVELWFHEADRTFGVGVVRSLCRAGHSVAWRETNDHRLVGRSVPSVILPGRRYGVLLLSPKAVASPVMGLWYACPLSQRVVFPISKDADTSALLYHVRDESISARRIARMARRRAQCMMRHAQLRLADAMDALGKALREGATALRGAARRRRSRPREAPISPFNPPFVQSTPSLREWDDTLTIVLIILAIILATGPFLRYAAEPNAWSLAKPPAIERAR